MLLMIKNQRFFLGILILVTITINFSFVQIYCFENKANEKFIKINYPNSSVMLKQGDTTYVEWQDAEGKEVNIYIYRGDILIGEFIKGVENNGRSDKIIPIPYSWGIGNDFKLLIEDGNRNVGMSENFTIISNIIKLKIESSVLIPQFGDKIENVGTAIIWYEKDASILLANDLNIIELPYNGSEFNMQSVFGSLMRDSIRGIDKVGNLLWGVDLKTLTIRGFDKGTSGEKYKLPEEITDPSGFAYDSSFYYISDLKTNKVYKLLKDGIKLKIKESFVLTEKAIRDIRWHNNYFWACDINKIYIYDKTMNLTKVYEVPVYIDGIAFYGEQVWACALDKEEIYMFLLPK